MGGNTSSQSAKGEEKKVISDRSCGGQGNTEIPSVESHVNQCPSQELSPSSSNKGNSGADSDNMENNGRPRAESLDHSPGFPDIVPRSSDKAENDTGASRVKKEVPFDAAENLSRIEVSVDDSQEVLIVIEEQEKGDEELSGRESPIQRLRMSHGGSPPCVIDKLIVQDITQKLTSYDEKRFKRPIDELKKLHQGIVELKIGVCGCTDAGKSSFMNFLVGDIICPVKHGEFTACLWELKYTESNPYFRMYFHGKDEPFEIDVSNMNYKEFYTLMGFIQRQRRDEMCHDQEEDDSLDMSIFAGIKLVNENKDEPSSSNVVETVESEESKKIEEALKKYGVPLKCEMVNKFECLKKLSVNGVTVHIRLIDLPGQFRLMRHGDHQEKLKEERSITYNSLAECDVVYFISNAANGALVTPEMDLLIEYSQEVNKINARKFKSTNESFVPLTEKLNFVINKVDRISLSESEEKTNIVNEKDVKRHCKEFQKNLKNTFPNETWKNKIHLLCCDEKRQEENFVIFRKVFLEKFQKAMDGYYVFKENLSFIALRKYVTNHMNQQYRVFYNRKKELESLKSLKKNIHKLYDSIKKEMRTFCMEKVVTETEKVLRSEEFVIKVVEPEITFPGKYYSHEAKEYYKKNIDSKLKLRIDHWFCSHFGSEVSVREFNDGIKKCVEKHFEEHMGEDSAVVEIFKELVTEINLEKYQESLTFNYGLLGEAGLGTAATGALMGLGGIAVGGVAIGGFVAIGALFTEAFVATFIGSVLGGCVVCGAVGGAVLVVAGVGVLVISAVIAIPAFALFKVYDIKKKRTGTAKQEDFGKEYRRKFVKEYGEEKIEHLKKYSKSIYKTFKDRIMKEKKRFMKLVENRIEEVQENVVTKNDIERMENSLLECEFALCSIQHDRFFEVARTQRDSIGHGVSKIVYEGTLRKKGDDQNKEVKVAIQEFRAGHNSITRELHFLLSFNNPNVLPMYTAKKTANSLMVITPLANGGNLAEYIQKNIRIIDISTKMDLMIGVARGLAYVADVFYIQHRDIKLDNFLVQIDHGSPTILLADFGQSKLSYMTGTSFPGNAMSEIRIIINRKCGYDVFEIINGERDFFEFGIVIKMILSLGARIRFILNEFLEDNVT